MTKRSKLILGIIAVAIIIFSGALFGLAKYGVIHIKMLADEATESLYIRPVDSSGNDMGVGVPVYASLSGSVVQSVNTQEVTQNPDGSNTTKANLAIFSLTPNTTYEITAGTFTCKLNATVGSVGKTALNPFVYSCNGSNAVSTQIYWTLNGTITSSAGTALSGVSVSFGGKSAASDYSGAYTISQIPIPQTNGTNDVNALKNQIISVSKTGYQSLNPKVSNIWDGISTAESFSITSPHAYNPKLTADSNDENVAPPTTFDLFGEIYYPGESGNTYIPGVKVGTRRNCDSLKIDSNKTLCGAHNSDRYKEAISQEDKIGSISANYMIEELWDCGNLTNSEFPEFKISIDINQGSGYYFDLDKNGYFDQGEDGMVYNADTITKSNMRSPHSFHLSKKSDDKKYYIVGGRTTRLGVKSSTNGPDHEIIGGIKLEISGSGVDAKTTSSDSSVVDSISKKTGNYFFHDILDKSGEFTLKADLSDSKYACAPNSVCERKIILPSDDYTTYTGEMYQGVRVYYLEYSMNFILDSSKNPKMLVYGKFLNVDDIYLKDFTAKVFHSGRNPSLDPSDNGRAEYITYDESLNNPNYVIEVPWLIDAEYIITADTKNNKFIISKDEYGAKFLGEDAIFNESENAYIYRYDFTIYPSNLVSLTLDLRNANTGQPAYNQYIPIEIKVRCFSKKGEEANSCVNNIQFNESDKTFRVVFGYVGLDFVVDYYLLEISDPPGFNTYVNKIQPISPQKIYLIPENIAFTSSNTDLWECRTFNEVKFCTFKIISSEVFSAKREDNLKKIAEIYKYFIIMKPNQNRPAIFIEGTMSEIQFINNLTLVEVDNIALTIRHIINNINEINIVNDLQYLNNFARARSVGRGFYDEKETRRIDRADGNPVRSCAEIFPDFPVFAGSKSDDRTAYVNMIIDWLVNHDNITTQINDPRMSIVNNLHCSSALRNMDWIINSMLPSFRVFSPNGGLSKDSASSAKSSGYNIVSIMNEAGYKESTKNSYKAVAAIAYFSPTTEQIAKGLWLKENYDKLKNTDKAKIQVTILANRIINATASSKATTVVRESLVTLNTQMEKWLKAIGFKFTTASLRGIITDQTGVPVSGLNVIYGKKTDITDKLGSFTLNRVVSGTDQIVEVVDNHIGKTYTYTLRPTAKVTVNDDEQKGPLQFQIQRKELWVRGQIMQGDTPLSGGKVFIDGSPAIAISEDGRFGIKLKEGQYSFTFYNKNNKKLTVTNPGSYEDLPAVKVKAPAAGNVAENSMIWVK